LKKVWLIVGGAAAVIFLLLLFRKSEPPVLAFSAVKRQTLVSMLPTNGKVEPLEWQSVRAATPGMVTSVAVREGQDVPVGTLIARISQPGLEDDLHSAEARASQYRSDLKSLEGGGKSSDIADLEALLAKAQFEHEQAQMEYDSLKRLYEKQAATRVEVLLAKARVDAAALSIRTLQERRAALVGPNDLSAGQARVGEAEADLRAEQVKLGIGTVRSPMAGVAYSLPAKPGAYVKAGDLIANVGRLDEMRVKVFVDEPELGRVHIGLPVVIRWDGLPNREWEGTVERMPTEIVPLGSRQVGEVWVTIRNQNRALVPGVTVNAEIRTSTAPNALTIPKTALRRDRNPAGVYVLRAGHLAWQPVKTGIADVSNIAIVDGLQEGDLVLLPTDVPVKEGDRVRAVVQ